MLKLQDYKNLDPLARGELFQKLKEEKQLSYQGIARKIKMSPAYVVNSVRLLNLPIAIKDGLLGELISEGHARALITIKDARECVEVYKNVLKSHASVRETEEMVRNKVKAEEIQINKSKAELIKKNLEKKLKQRFKAIQIKQTRRRLQIILERE